MLSDLAVWVGRLVVFIGWMLRHELVRLTEFKSL